MKPTQEDLEYIAEEIMRWEHQEDELFPGWYQPGFGVQWKSIKLPDLYNDDSFTGALVKAVFPILAEKGWYLVPHSDGQWTIGEFHRSSDIVILTAPNLNTALIEAWKKAEGHNKT